ncbi:sensor domain-containing diguanylate cyclase [Lysobacter solisilvae (ex Woo and Kim 2020)]|uniref:diguanylate cyclase n=1 Tax=Agrilutibacter terrestris TaxID=2865112 RepID=A0A7H0G0F4_9GAMM|nr:diguanylate cyclase [Lysobacter terrestris]QNP41770.1 diguanylate cyclase [Lysobacter terrestris]
MKAAWWAMALLAWLVLMPAGAEASHASNGVARIERLHDGIATTAAQVQAQPERAWTPTAEPHQLAGAQHGGWWRVHALPAQGSRLLLVYHPYSARLTVLAPPHYQPQRGSIFDPGADSGHSRRALAFAWPDTTAPIYVGVEDARYPLQLAVRSSRDFASEDYGHVRVLWLCLGILIGVSLVTLLFWLQLRERVYLLFAATMALQLLYVLLAYGDAYALAPLSWLARFGAEGIWFVATSSTIVTVFFLLDFAELRPRAPRLSTALLWVGAILPTLLLAALLVSAVLPGTSRNAWFPPIGNGLLLLANVIAIVTLVAVWLRGGRHAGFVLIAWVPLVFVTTARALQLGAGQPLNPWLEYGLPLMQAFAAVVLVLGLAHRMRTFQRERDAAQQDAEHDALTRVLNRAGMMRRLDRAIADSRHRPMPLSVLFLDLDHFKRINDTHGHAVGDACLCAVIDAIHTQMQPEQQLGRIGGEEFLLLLPGSARRHARDLAERIREQVEARCASVQGAPVGLTLSIGVVECQAMDGTQSLLQRADEAMYRAKHEGRNRVVVLDARDTAERRNAVMP